MFFHKSKNGKIQFEINGNTYVVTNETVKKYNYNKRNEQGIAMKEKLEMVELENLVIALTKSLYKQNKIFANNLIRGISI